MHAPDHNSLYYCLAAINYFLIHNVVGLVEIGFRHFVIETKVLQKSN
jgi:hypothetical protein